MQSLHNDRSIESVINRTPQEIWDCVIELLFEPQDGVVERAKVVSSLSSISETMDQRMSNSSPALGTIEVDSIGQHDKISKQHLDSAKYLLTKSKVRRIPLFLKLTEHSGDPQSEEYKVVEELMPMFFDSVEQWRSVHFNISATHHSLREKLKEIAGKDLNLNLRSARIEFYGDNSEANLDIEEVWNALRCDALKHIYTTFSDAAPYVPKNIPYKQLTCLVLHEEFAMELAPLLSFLKVSCPDLQELGLRGLVCSASEKKNLPEKNFNMLRLRQLLVCEDGSGAVNTLLRKIHAPVLSNLRIKYYDLFDYAKLQVLDNLANCNGKTFYLDICQSEEHREFKRLKATARNVTLCVAERTVSHDIEMMLSENLYS
ncbi:hypothetical protein BDQ17DRAFT_1366517 [Cyathus striatus]|nr:hypothetical protein BDQ17DRAFT_1366517 [Cyathus striatus]